MPLKVRTEMVHVEYKNITKADGSEVDPRELDWHQLSAHSEGIKFHIGTTNYTASLRVFRDMDALNLKRRCFHPKGLFCNCVSASSNRMMQATSHSPPRRWPFKQSRPPKPSKVRHTNPCARHTKCHTPPATLKNRTTPWDLWVRGPPSKFSN